MSTMCATIVQVPGVIAVKNGTEIPSVQLEGGLRLKGEGKESKTSRPLVSIITATFNAAEHLPRTIKSIRDLSYKNVEWIVMDGASKDKTVELIRQNEDIVGYLKSEADGGIYDAWNKGISFARGDWIAFLGAGDSYSADAIDVYMDAIGLSPVTPEFASSNARLVDGGGMILRVVGAPFQWETLVKYMTVAHVGALHHKSLFQKWGRFDKSYSSAADYEFLMRCGAGMKAIYIDTVTVDMLIGGVSNGYKGIFETYRIQRKYGAGIAAAVQFLLASAKRFIRPLLRGY